jgi:hypothetical protein
MTVLTKSPTAVPAGTPWANATRAYDDGGAGYASTSTDTAYQQYGTYAFADPGGTTSITVVRIRADAWSATGEWINIAFSVDGGSNWTSKGAEHPGTTETTIWWDITSLKTWTWTLLTDANFRTRVTATKSGGMGEVDLDWIPVEVTYTVVTNVTVTDAAKLVITKLVHKPTLPVSDSSKAASTNVLSKNLISGDGLKLASVKSVNRTTIIADSLNFVNVALRNKSPTISEGVNLANIKLVDKQDVVAEVVGSVHAVIQSGGVTEVFVLDDFKVGGYKEW